MDYSQYKQIEFRRKFWKILGVDITVYDSVSNSVIAFINQKAIQLKPDVFVYTDPSKQQSVVELKKQAVLAAKPKYDIIDTQTQQGIGSMQFSNFRSYLTRWHIDVLDAQGNQFGYVQETSSFLALLRRWIGLFNDLAELLLAFVPQTFDIYYTPNGSTPQLVGKITHKKNPFLVRMSLDLTQGQTTIDPKMNLAMCTLLCLRDINKNS
jgi:hypothetical protein